MTKFVFQYKFFFLRMFKFEEHQVLETEDIITFATITNLNNFLPLIRIFFKRFAFY